MRLGIIGLPQSGKTTVFNVLICGNQPLTTSGGRFEVHTGVVDVPDERIDRLVTLFKPKKITHAKVTYADVAGLEGGKATLSGTLLNQLSQMDGFLHVVRCFDSYLEPHPAGSVDPARDIAAMDTELLLNDLIMVERKLDKLNEERKKSGSRDKSIIDRENALFSRFQQALSQEIPLREVEISPEEEKLLYGFGFLTRKPLLVLFNLAEGQDPPDLDYNHPSTGLVSLQGKLEMELTELPPEEAQIFMAEYGIEELGLSKVIRRSYDLQNLMSFFTVGPDEVRAWRLPKGKTAYEAAGAIHSDLQKGFIRAEVIAWDELLALGGLSEARAKGKLRLEGKEYYVKDGEIVHIRFNI